MLSRVHSQTPFESGLSGSFSDHSAANAWSSEKGTNASCWEMDYGTSKAEGDSRHQAPTTTPSWNSTIVVNTPVTKGGSGANYDSSLPNH